MTKSVSIAIVVIAVVIVAAFLFVLRGRAPAPSQILENVAGNRSAAPSGNVDDAVQAVLDDMALDAAMPSESDPSLLSEDDQAINALGQSVNAAGL